MGAKQQPKKTDPPKPVVAKEPAPPFAVPDYGPNSASPLGSWFGPAPDASPLLGGGLSGPPTFDWWTDEGTVGISAPAPTQDAAALPTDAPATPPAPAVDQERVRTSTQQIYDAMEGFGTTETDIYDALRGRSPAEIAAIRSEYLQHYHVSLDDALASELSGTELAEATALMSSNRVEATIAGLHNSLGTFDDDEARIEQLMRDLTPEELARLRADPRYELAAWRVRGAIGGEDREVFDALEQGNRADASAIRLDGAMWGAGTDEDAIYRNAGNLPPEERAQVEAAFARRLAATGRRGDLRGYLRDELGGADLDRATAVLDDDVSAEGAARLAQTMDGGGTSEAELFRQLEDQSLTPAQRAARRAVFEQRYGSLDGYFEGDLSGSDLERAQMADRNGGQLDPTFAMFHAMEGNGTQEDELLNTLRGRSAAEIQQIRERWNNGPFRARYGADFDTALNSELSGREHFDIVEIGLRGEPRTPQEMREVMRLQYQYERGSRSGAFGGDAMDLMAATGFSTSGEVLDRDYARMEAMFDAQGNFVGDEAEAARVFGWSQQDVASYRAAKDSVTDALVTGAELAVGTLVTIATSGVAAPWLATLIGSLAAGGSGMAVRRGMQGDAYGREAITADALRTALSAGLGAAGDSQVLATRIADLTRVFGSEMTRQIVSGMAKQGYSGLASGLEAGLTDEAAWDRGGAEWLGSLADNTLTGSYSSAAGGAVSSPVRRGMGRIVDPTRRTGAATTGAVRGASTRIVSGLADHRTYEEGDAGEVMSRLVRRGMNGAMTGALSMATSPRDERYRDHVTDDDSAEGVRYRNELAMHELTRLERRGVNIDSALALSDDYRAMQAEIVRLQGLVAP